MNKLKENNKGYKYTPLGRIPKDWRYCSVDELVNENILYKPLDGNHGNIHPKEEDFVTQGIPFIMANSVHDGILDLTVCKFLRKEQADKLQKGFSISNDVLLTHKATVGNTAIVGKLKTPYIILSPQVTYYRIRNREKLSNGYLKQYFNGSSFQSILKVFSGGGTRSYIGITNQRKLPVILPPISEQDRLQSILSAWDKAIEKIQQLINRKEVCKKALMKQLLAGRKRLPGFKDKWKIKELGTILIPVTRPVEKPSKSFLALGIRSHGKGTFLKEEFDPSTIEMDTLYKVKENDLIINITFAWEGAVAIVGSQDDCALVSHRFPTFTFNSKEGIVDYFRYVILQPRFKYMLGLISPGGAGRNRVLSKTDFLKLELKLPDTKEQLAIAKVLTTADKELKLLRHKLELLKKQKRGLMQKLLTGQIRVRKAS